VFRRAEREYFILKIHPNGTAQLLARLKSYIKFAGRAPAGAAPTSARAGSHGITEAKRLSSADTQATGRLEMTGDGKRD